MTKHYAKVSDGIDLTRKWSTLALANFEQIAALSLDQFEAFFDRSSDQLKTAISSLDAAQEPVQWTEIALTNLRKANDSAREVLIAASNYQMESMQVLLKRAEEAQKLLTASLARQFPHIESVNADENSGRSTRAPVQKSAA